MFPLDRLLKAFVKYGELTVIDASGQRHVFTGKSAVGPEGETLAPVTLKIHDAGLYRKIVLNP
ncbi:MAG: hypothetical protein MUE79_00830, partial [Nitratireductor sp.]|nr:hypothetical protein [Nitratireductor sp.]